MSSLVNLSVYLSCKGLRAAISGWQSELLLILGGICRQLALIEICQQMYTQIKVYRQSHCIQLSKVPPNANI